MANGNGGVSAGKLIGIFIGVMVAINSIWLFVLREHWDEIQQIELKHRMDMEALRSDLRDGTRERYYKSDNVRDMNLINEKFENVRFRFQRNEEHIAECLRHVRRPNG